MLTPKQMSEIFNISFYKACNIKYGKIAIDEKIKKDLLKIDNYIKKIKAKYEKGEKQ